MAEQGQEYRIVGPKGELPKVYGQGPPPDRYTSTFTKDGQTTVVEDVIGDVIYASENVTYPRGPQEQYRHVDWIAEHAERFKLIETPKND